MVRQYSWGKMGLGIFCQSVRSYAPSINKSSSRGQSFPSEVRDEVDSSLFMRRSRTSSSGQFSTMGINTSSVSFGNSRDHKWLDFADASNFSEVTYR